MADPLYTTLNKDSTDPQTAGTVDPNLKRTLLGSTWLRDAVDSVSNLDVPTLAAALDKVAPSPLGIVKGIGDSPWLQGTIDELSKANVPGILDAASRGIRAITMPSFNTVKETADPKSLENVRMTLGAGLQGVPDAFAGLAGLPSLASEVSTAHGGPEIPHKWSDAVSQGIEDYSQPVTKAIAGRDLPSSLLQGTGPEIGASWLRSLVPFAVPIPRTVSEPVLNTLRGGISKVSNNSAAVANLTDKAGKVLEVLTPLAINPTPGRTAAAIGIGAVQNPIGEAGWDAYLKKKQQTSDDAAKIAENQAVQGADQIIQATASPGATQSAQPSAPSVTQANILPSTGSTTADLILGGVVFGSLMYARRRQVGEMVANAKTTATRMLTGYDPTIASDKTFQNLRVQMAQQHTSAAESVPESTRRALKEVGATNADDYADKMREDLSQRTGAPLSQRIESFRRDGEWLDSGVKSQPWNEFEAQLQQLSPQEYQDWAARMHARQEVDLRQRIVNRSFFNTGPVGSPQADAVIARMAAPGGNVHLNNYGYNLFNTPTADLLSTIARADTNPNIAAAAQAWYKYVQDGAKYTVTRNRFTAAESSQFLRNNPHFVPPNLPEGGYVLNDRDIVSNWNKNTGQSIPRGLETMKELGDPLPAMSRYVDELFRSTEGETMKRQWMVDAQRLADMGSQHMKDILGRGGRLGSDAAHKQVSWRDAYGNKQYREINDAVVRDALKGIPNPSQLQLVRGALSASAHLYQSGAVGPLSLVHGTVFAPDSALYTIGGGTVYHAPRGVARGVLDKAMLKASGGKMYFPGDPTLIAASIPHAVGNIGAVFLDRASQALHNSVMRNGYLTKLVDPATLDGMARTLATWYKKTGMYDMQQKGLMGPASSGVVDRSRIYNMSQRDIFNRQRDVMAAPGTFRTGYRFVDDVLHAIASSPQQAITSLNRNLLADPKQAWKVSATIRNLSGDPGKSGAFRNAPREAKAVAAIPWMNPSIQEGARFAESIRRNPHRLALGLFTGTVAPAMMATMWNASQGPQYSQYEFFGRSPDKVGSHLYFAKPGALPEEGWEIPITPFFRPFKLLGHALAGGLLGVFGGEIHKGENADMKAAMDDMVNFRMSPTNMQPGNSMYSVLGKAILPPLPPVITAPLAAVGVKVDSPLDFLNPKQMSANRGAGFIQGTQPDPTHHQLLGYSMPAHMEDVMNALGASGMQAIYSMFTGVSKDVTGTAHTPPMTYGQALDYQYEGWKQNLRGNTIGQLFGTSRAVAPNQEAAAPVVKSKMDTINQIADAYNATTLKGGPREVLGNKKIGVEMPRGEMPVGAPDADTQNFAADVTKIRQQLQPYLQQIQMHYKQRSSIQADDSLPPDEKRLNMNQESYKIIDVNRRMLQDMLRFEQILSAKYKTHINFSTFDKSKSVNAQ